VLLTSWVVAAAILSVTVDGGIVISMVTLFVTVTVTGGSGQVDGVIVTVVAGGHEGAEAPLIKSRPTALHSLVAEQRLLELYLNNRQLA